MARTKNFDNGISSLTRDKLEIVLNKSLNYKGLCTELDLPTLGGESKKKQIQELATLCSFNVTQSPTRYTITEIYPEAIKALDALNGNDKFQTMFEAVMYQALLNNHNQPLYLSNLDLLKLFCEVNENFAYACNRDNMIQMGDEYFYMTDMGLTVYRILKGWTLDRLDRMHDRHIVNRSRGYRAYQKMNGDFGIYEKGINAPRNSELARRCAKVCRKAEDAWYETTGMLRPEEKERRCKEKGIRYDRRMPKSYYDAIKAFRRKFAIEEFKEEDIVNVRPINIIDSPGDEWLRDRLKEIYKKYPALESINEEACRKVLETTQLDELELTEEQKIKFIKVNMKPRPNISFKQELRKIKEAEKENENELWNQ